MIIRGIKPTDFKEIYELGKSPELANPDGKPPRKFWIKSFTKNNKLSFVAEENKKLVGFLLGEITSGKIAMLQEIFVIKEFRKKKIGSLLLDSFEKEAKKKKLKAILLYAYAENKKTINFWKKHKYLLGSKMVECVKFL